MTNADRPAFAVLMLGLGETYGEAISDARMEIYFAALADLELRDVRMAANAHVRLEKFFPRPAELRSALQGSAEDRADLAWQAVLALVRRHGYYNPPADDAWPDAVTRKAALNLYGGWRSLCEKLPGEGPELLGAAKLFKATFRAYDGHAQRLGLPAGDVDDGGELTPAQARARLDDLKTQLRARGLPDHGLL